MTGVRRLWTLNTWRTWYLNWLNLIFQALFDCFDLPRPSVFTRMVVVDKMPCWITLNNQISSLDKCWMDKCCTERCCMDKCCMDKCSVDKCYTDRCCMDKCCMVKWYWVTCQQSRMVPQTWNVLHGTFPGGKLKLMLTQSSCAGAGTELGNSSLRLFEIFIYDGLKLIDCLIWPMVVAEYG